MKSEKILDSIALIDEKYIDEAISEIPKVKKKGKVLKLTLVAVILIFCMTFAVPTFAVSTSMGYDVLYAMFPSVAQKLKPVQMSCVDNGIKMEVIAANVTDTEAQVYISMRDLTGDRIDETTDLFDSYDIRRPFDSSATCSMVDYDASAKTATFLIQMDWYDTRKLLGSKVTFSVKEFLSRKQEWNGYIDSINLSEVGDAKETITNVSTRGGSYSDDEIALLDEKSAYLKPVNDGIITSPVDGVEITGIGYIDGKLHIQTYFDNIVDYDNHGFIYLVDENGGFDYGEQSVAFWDEKGVGSYEEQVFDITPEELSKCRVYGEFVTSDSLTQGDWEVTFRLD
ncbi:MAG: hypothetical protein IJC86_01420 [Clostridia bacterium]|nr:hypothetical protein [Clostridia bacterium]